MPDTGGMPIGYEVDDVALSRQKAAAARRAMTTNALENVIDIREYDVPYYVRAAIDNGNVPISVFYLFIKVLPINPAI